MGAPVRPGEIVKGKYRIDRVIGEGGMGVVVAAHHLALDQRVAIKFLLRALLAEPLLIERFAREARAASKIESEHVARVTDVDALDDGTPFIVMEYLEGRDLSIVSETTRVPVPVAVGYLLEACEAIGEAHRRGIIHRDIKPANLFLATRGDGSARVKVLDFGISKLGAADHESPDVTSTGTTMGSAEYMPPEQMLSARSVDARTDIWALGVTLYELLTGRVPFPGDTVTQVYARVMSRRPKPPSAFRPDVPPGLDRVILRCLAIKRDERYGSVAELCGALAPYEAADVVKPPPALFWAPSAVPERVGPRPSFTDAKTLPWRPAVPAGTPGTVYTAPDGTVGGTTSLVESLPRTSMWPIALGAVGAAALGFGVVAVALVYGSGEVPPAAAAPAEPTVAPAPQAVTTAPTAAPPTINVADLPDALPAPPASPPAAKPTSVPKPTVRPKPTVPPRAAKPRPTHRMD